MEAVIFRSSPDKPISPYKTNHKTGVANGIMSCHHPSSISRPSENFVPPLLNQLYNTTTGLLQAPPQLLPPNYSPFHSYPPFSMQQKQKQKQPPLLPLPMISSTKPNKPIIHSTCIKHPGIIRGLSLPPTSTNRKPHYKASIRSRDSASLTPKKSKTINPTKEESFKPLGPDPKDLPNKDVPKTSTLLSGSPSTNAAIRDHDEQAVDEFSAGSVVFTISPPPSSLPLPTFSLRPKLGCNAEAGGIDAGATDNLCRLLRLR